MLFRWQCGLGGKAISKDFGRIGVAGDSQQRERHLTSTVLGDLLVLGELLANREHSVFRSGSDRVSDRPVIALPISWPGDRQTRFVEGRPDTPNASVRHRTTTLE